MAFQRDFNDLLREILTSYRNNMTGDITPGSVLFIKAACTASMLWGLYRSLDRAVDQFFVATADSDYIARHAAEYGIPTEGRTDMQIVEDVMAAKRSRLTGGSRYDYVAWAKAVNVNGAYATDAIVFRQPNGEGTFDVVLSDNQDGGQASPELCAVVYEYIDERRPVGSGYGDGMRVVAAVPTALYVHVECTGARVDLGAIRSAIVDYVNTLLPNERARGLAIAAIAYQYGAETATVDFTRDLTPSPPDAVPQVNAAQGEYQVWRPIDYTLNILVSEGAP